MSITVTHKFVSPKSEQTDPTLVGPNEWNASHTVVDSSNIYNASDFNFTCFALGSAVTGGIGSVITIANVPLGVNGTDTAHYLYINDGANSEAVLITGGTAVSGGINQTLTFTPAHNHASTALMCSATGGIQEALIYAPMSAAVGYPAEVRISKNITCYASVTFPASAYAIQGLSFYGPTVSRVAGGNFNLFIVPSGSIAEFRQLVLVAPDNTASVASISATSSTLILLDCQIQNGYYGIYAQTMNYFFMDNCYVFNGLDQGPPQCSVQINGPGSNINIVNSQIGGWVVTPNRNNVGLTIKNIDGVLLSNTGCSGAYGILIQATPGNMLQNIWIDNCRVDTFFNAAVSFQGQGAAFNSIRIANSHFNGQGKATGPGIDLGTLASCNADNIQILGCNIQSAWLDGIAVNLPSLTNLIISDNYITDNALVNDGSHHGINIASGSGVSIHDNTIGNGYEGAGHQVYGIVVGSGCVTNISGNKLTGNSAGPIQPLGTFAGILSTNRGIDDITGTIGVTSGTAAFPVNPHCTLNSASAVSAVSGLWAGASGTFVNSNATPGAWTAGATIGNTLTPVTNVPVLWWFDGSKIWLK